MFPTPESLSNSYTPSVVDEIENFIQRQLKWALLCQESDVAVVCKALGMAINAFGVTPDKPLAVEAHDGW